jgi:uncharacterized membrane protein
VLLVTLLILNEVSLGRVTIGWGIEAVIAFLFALVVGERSFRLAGLGLLLICVAKIGLLDAWRLHGSDRYVTLIILGMAFSSSPTCTRATPNSSAAISKFLRSST